MLYDEELGCTRNWSIFEELAKLQTCSTTELRAWLLLGGFEIIDGEDLMLGEMTRLQRDKKLDHSRIASLQAEFCSYDLLRRVTVGALFFGLSPVGTSMIH